VHYYEKVFIVAEVDDTYIYHIHLEIMPRIIYHLDWLLRNPDVRIVWGCDTKPKARLTQAGLEAGLQAMQPFMEMVGLSMERLVVHQHVYAQEAWYPMEGGCQDPVYNTWQILRMRQVFFRKMGLDLFTSAPIASIAQTKTQTPQTQTKQLEPQAEVEVRGGKPVLLLLKRSAGSKVGVC